MNKKVILVIIVVLVVCGVGYFLFQKGNGDSLSDQAFKDAALKYFDEEVSVYSGTLAYNITLKQLKEAGYDLKGYDRCDENKTYAVVSIDVSGKVTSTKIEKKC